MPQSFIKRDDFSGGITDTPEVGNITQSEIIENMCVMKNKSVETRPGLDFMHVSNNSPRYAAFGTDRKVSYIEEINNSLNKSRLIGANSLYIGLSEWNGALWTPINSLYFPPASPVKTKFLPVPLITTPTIFTRSIKYNNFYYITKQGYTARAGAESPTQPSFVAKVLVSETTPAQGIAVQAGLPGFYLTSMTNSLSFVVTMTGGSGSYSYIFGICLFYDVNGTRTRGPIYQVQFTGTSTGTMSMTLENGGVGLNMTSVEDLIKEFWYNDMNSYFYDEAFPGVSPDIKMGVEIYRTTANGTILYRVGEHLTNTFATPYTNSVSDTTINNPANRSGYPSAYTSGGILDNDSPPDCADLMLHNDYTYYYLHNDPRTINNTRNRIWQSKKGIPDAVPGGNFVDLDSDVTGMFSILGSKYATTLYKTYRLDGNFGEDGSGVITPVCINDKIGCWSSSSLVKIYNGAGVVWLGELGVCFSDGTRVIYISNSMNETYASLMSGSLQKVQTGSYGYFHGIGTGTYDDKEKRVYWAVSKNYTKDSFEKMLVLHEYFGITAESCFTILSFNDGLDDQGNIKIIKYLDNRNSTNVPTIFRSDADYGLLLEMRYDFYKDVLYKNSAALSSTWGFTRINEKIISSYLYGDEGSGVRKWGIKLFARCANKTFLSLQPSVTLDGNNDQKPLSQIISGKKNTDNSEQVLYEEDYELYRRDNRDVLRVRKMPSGYARFNSRQVVFEKAYTIVQSFDSGLFVPTVTINTGTNNITFDSGTVPDTDVLLGLDMFFKTNDPQSPNFVNIKYEIDSVVDSDTVHVVGDLTQLPVSADGKYNWIVKAYNLGEYFNLKEFILYYVPFSTSYETTPEVK